LKVFEIERETKIALDFFVFVGIPRDGDRRFRAIVIAIPGWSWSRFRFSEWWSRWSRNVLHRDEVALDITEGKLFSEGNLGRDSVPTRRLSMRKIKEVLRLRFELGLGQREIARACSISQGAVHSYLKKAAAAEVCWPLPEGWDEPRVELGSRESSRSLAK
jgi:hypothetical protein